MTAEMREQGEPSLVSVVVPVYNTELYLPKCLNSLLGQTWRNIEIICIDDGSTDGSLSLLRDFEQRDSCIRVFTQPNARQGAARNRGMAEARGEFIFFMDSDDRLHPSAIEIMVGLAERERADVVSFGMRQVDSHQSEMLDVGQVEYRITENPLDYCSTKAGYRIVCTPCRLFRRALLDGVRFIPGISHEDEAFTWEVMLRHPRTVMIKNVLYDYLQNPDSTMHREFTACDVRYFCQVIDYLLGLYPERGKDRRALVRKIIPRLLKEQFSRISKLKGDVRTSAESVFACELRGLSARRAYSVWGIGLRRHMRYRKITAVGDGFATIERLVREIELLFDLKDVRLAFDKSKDIGNFIFKGRRADRDVCIKYSDKEPMLIWNEYEMTRKFFAVAPEHALNMILCLQLSSGAACVMDWCDGVSIRESLDKHVATGDSIVNQLRNVLIVLRRAGICHRDLWIGNLLVDKGGAVKVIDFQQSIKEFKVHDAYEMYFLKHPSWLYSYRNLGCEIGFWSDYFLLEYSLKSIPELQKRLGDIMRDDIDCKQYFFSPLHPVMKLRLVLNWMWLELKVMFRGGGVKVNEKIEKSRNLYRLYKRIGFRCSLFGQRRFVEKRLEMMHGK